MNVRDLILSDTTEIETAEATAKKRQRTRPVTTWEVVMSDACDGAIRRKTAKTSRLLVLLMSQGQFYIKDENTDGVEMLNATNLAKFLAGSDYTLNAVPWCTGMGGGGRSNAEEFVRIVNNDDFQWLAKRGLHAFTYSNKEWRNSNYELSERHKSLDSPISKLINKLAEETIGHERWAEVVSTNRSRNEMELKLLSLKQGQSVSTMEKLIERCGLDWTREFVRSFINAPYVGNSLPASYLIMDLLRTCNFDPTSLREYLFGESVRQGFGIVTHYGRDDMYNFLRIWNDTLSMQKSLRGRVYDKYPDDLAGLHQRLSFRCAMQEIEIDRWKFEEHTKRLSENELERDGYLIRAPRNKDDMLDEATQQANCLASYVRSYADDETDIYFLRSTEDPDKSLVTVEVRDGRIRQAYRACNRQPSNEELAWLNKWADKIGVVGLDAARQHPMCA